MDPQPLSFAVLGLPDDLVSALGQAGITEPFPIQTATIPDALAGRDVLGRGRTGSGKTLAFGLPLLARLASEGSVPRKQRPRSLILVPTRELANQVASVLSPLARAMDLRTTTIYGGVGYGKQIDTLRNGVDIVVACPGRFVDLLRSGHARLDDVSITVLDEADHMAELGFLEDVTEILDETPPDSQRLLFSATLDRGIDKVARKYLTDPVSHEIETVEEDAGEMTHYFFAVNNDHRLPVITDLCAAPGKSLVFTRTKHGARKLTESLVKAGVPSVELHGDLSQKIRARNLAAFSGGRVDTLVATDIAARGIHVDDVALVIHADPPEEHKAFLHRSGRTARAGAAGTVVTIVRENMRRHVRKLAKEAEIQPVNKTVVPGDEILAEIAPGAREFREMPNLEERTSSPAGGRRKGPQRARRGPARDGSRRDDPRRDSRPRGGRVRDDRERDDRRRDNRVERDRGGESRDRDDRGPGGRRRDERDDRREGRPRFERDRNDRNDRGDRRGSQDRDTRGREGRPRFDGERGERRNDGRDERRGGAATRGSAPRGSAHRGSDSRNSDRPRSDWRGPSGPGQQQGRKRPPSRSRSAQR